MYTVCWYIEQPLQLKSSINDAMTTQEWNMEWNKYVVSWGHESVLKLLMNEVFNQGRFIINICFGPIGPLLSTELLLCHFIKLKEGWYKGFVLIIFVQDLYQLSITDTNLTSFVKTLNKLIFASPHPTLNSMTQYMDCPILTNLNLMSWSSFCFYFKNNYSIYFY